MVHESTFGPVSFFGSALAGFRPHAARRPDVPPARDKGPGLEASLAGASAHPQDLEIAPREVFTAGGWNRGAALRHLQLGAEGTVKCEGGVLGDKFNAHLRRMSPEALLRLHRDYREGVDVCVACQLPSLPPRCAPRPARRFLCHCQSCASG